MGFGWRAPGQLDEAGGDQWSHDVSGRRGGGACGTGYTSGAWRYMVSSVRSQWGGRGRGQGYVFGLGRGEGGRREGRMDGWRGVGTPKGAGDSGRVGGGERNVTQRSPKRNKERSWNGNDSETKERKEGNKKRRKNKIKTEQKKTVGVTTNHRNKTLLHIQKADKSTIQGGLHMQIYTQLSNVRVVGVEHNISFP